MSTTKRDKNKLTWIVEISVDRSWVADGFELDDERAQSMACKTLPYAYNFEIEARVLRSPNPKLIKCLQGYEEEAKPLAVRA